MLDKYFSADLSRHYMVPMSRLEDPDTKESLVRVTVRDGDRDYIIVIEKPGYRTKRMYKQYFEWLIYRNYIKVLDNIS